MSTVAGPREGYFREGDGAWSPAAVPDELLARLLQADKERMAQAADTAVGRDHSFAFSLSGTGGEAGSVSAPPPEPLTERGGG